MFNQHLDMDHREIIDYVNKSNSCSIYSKDQVAVSELILAIILEALGKKQTISLRLKDEELRRLVLTKIENYKLDNFTHHAIAPMPNAALKAKLNVLLKKNPTSVLIHESQNQFKKSLEKVERCCLAYNKAIFGNKTWKQITEIKDSRPNDTKSFHINTVALEFKFDQNEYWELKGLIETASKLWNPLYSQIISQNIFCAEMSFVDEHVDKLLLKRLEDLKQTKSSIYEVMDSYTKAITEKYYQHYHEANVLLELLESNPNEFKPNEVEKKGLSKLFGKKQAIHSTNSLMDQIKNNPIFKAVDFETSLDMIVGQLNDKLTAWRTTKQGEIQQNIKRLNKLNVDQNIYNPINLRLSGIYTDLNNDQVLDFKFENTAHSLIAQIEYLDKAIDLASRALWVCQNASGFLIWQKFIIEKSKDQRVVINALIKQGDETWLETFEHWYLQELVDYHRSPDTILDPSKVQMLPKQYQEAKREWINNWIIKSNISIHKTLNNLKKTSKETLSTILGKKDMSAKDYVIHLIDNKICPIVIGDTPTTHFVVSDQEVTIQKGQKPIVFDFEGMNKTDFTLQASKQIRQTLITYPLSKRLMTGKSLAYHLRLLSSQNRIFILKNKIVITCLSDLMNRKYLDQVKEDIVKEISLGSEPHERITEYLLSNELPCEVWVDHFIINDNKNNFILAQLKLIEAFKAAGLDVKSKAELNQIIKRKESQKNQKEFVLKQKVHSEKKQNIKEVIN